MRTLIWITNSFRLDSRLTANLADEVTFVYFSPYYFTNEREKKIYSTCSGKNLDAFYESINSFDSALASKGFKFEIFKESDPIKTINSLIEYCGYDKLIIDAPLFSMWQNIDLSKLDLNESNISIIDSALVDPECPRLTAKSRWMAHATSIDSYVPFKFSNKAKPFNIDVSNESYSKIFILNKDLDDVETLSRVRKMAKTYIDTRDKHDGQTRLSAIMHNGMIDPRDVFYQIAKDFKESGEDLTVNDGPAASMLRQLAFREIAIIQARRTGLTLENSALEWAESLMTPAAYTNLINQNPGGTVTFEKIKAGCTGVKELDIILKPFLKSGIMPNRARMLFASLVFYNSSSGLEALNTIMDTFDLLGIDGQSPNNIISICGALGLSYGKILKMNSEVAFKKLYN